MDPSSFPPPPTFTASPTVVPASAPPTAAAGPPAARLPSYPVMIGTAVVTLNKKNGSSKNAIAKFIEQNYSHVPSINPDLLTKHLDLMKTSGLLVMINKSYKLPPPTSTAQRKQGRPTKRKPNADDIQPQLRPVVPENASPQVTISGPGCSPEKMVNLVDQAVQAVPTKRRGRGRPLGSNKTLGSLPKPNTAWQPQPQPHIPENANSPAMTTGDDRPLEARMNTVDQAVPAALRGRPPKAKPAKSAFSKETGKNQITFAPPDPAVPIETLTPNTILAVPSDTSLPIKSSRGRGRPRKNATTGTASQDLEAGSGREKRPEDSTRRSFVQGTPSVEEELRSKLKYFQSKVNESLSVFKHHFNRAIAALQELESLAAMDLNVPEQLTEDDA